MISPVMTGVIASSGQVVSSGGGGGGSSGSGSGYSTTQVTLQGSSGMTSLYNGGVDDAAFNLGDLGFDFPYYNGSYRTNIFAVSNSYITFGFSTSQYSNLSNSSPAGPKLMIGAADTSLQRLYVQASAQSFRVRFEGGDSSSAGGPAVRFWEVTFFPNGVILLVRSTNVVGGQWFVTKGDGVSFTDFNPGTTTTTSFVITPNSAFTSYIVQPGSYTMPAPVVAGGGVPLTFASNGDANGVFYYLGSNNGTTAWSNPNPSKITTVADTIVSGFVAQLTDRVTNTYCSTNSAPNRWVAFDLGSGKTLAPNYYSFRHDGETGYYMRSWKLQGSNNAASNSTANLAAATWTDLDSQSNNTTINAPNDWFAGAVSGAAAYRWLRLLSTGSDSSNSNYLVVAEFEFYGAFAGTTATNVRETEAGQTFETEDGQPLELES